jgi:hypothetical protein
MGSHSLWLAHRSAHKRKSLFAKCQLDSRSYVDSWRPLNLVESFKPDQESKPGRLFCRFGFSFINMQFKRQHGVTDVVGRLNSKSWLINILEGDFDSYLHFIGRTSQV